MLAGNDSLALRYAVTLVAGAGALALLYAVLLGAVIDRFMPQVNSLPQAVRALLHR